MSSWIGQYCIDVADLERSVAFYSALGLVSTSRTEIPEAFEAILEHPGHGSRMQLAERRDKPFAKGNAFWKLYVNTRDARATYDTAIAAGGRPHTEPAPLDRWPVVVGFVLDPDDYLVEIVERKPWADTDPTDAPWLGQYCINVTDLDRAVAFWETLGLTCTSRTDIDQAAEALLEAPGKGGKLQLAQQHDLGGPFEMGSVWKLYAHTDDAAGLHKTAVEAGYTSVMDPVRLDRWPTTIAFVADPDGYQVELVQRDPD